MALPINLPHPVTENPIILRAAAILPAAGAFDAVPLELAVAGFRSVVLYITYTRGGAAGSVRASIEVSPFAANRVLPLQSWYHAALYAAAIVAAGVDAVSPVQREDIRYQATGATAEMFAYGPIQLAGDVERLRIACAEEGAVATPGDCEIVGVLYE